MTKATDRNLLLTAICAALATGAFIIDLLVPAEVATGVLYGILVLAGLWFPRQRRAILILAIVGTILAALGLALAPGMPAWEWQVATNRSLAVLAIWAIALAAIRERTLAEAVREGAGRYQALIEASPDAIYIHREGTIILANHRAAELFGAPENELIGRRVFDFINEDSVPLARARTAALTAPGMLAGLVELTFRKLDGSPFPAEVTASAVLLDERLAIQVVVRDVSARRRSEALVRESQALLQATFDAVPIPVAVAALDRTILMWNPAAERVFGYRADEVIGHRYVDLMANHAEEEIFSGYFEQALAGKTLVGVAAKRTARNGKVVDISFSCIPIHAQGGSLPAVVYVLEDVTQKNIVQAQLRQAQKMKAIGNLTGGLAHDFNNLLAVIAGNLELAVPLVGRETDAGELINEAIVAVWSGAELTRQLLAFARQQPLQSTSLALNGLVGHMARLLGRTLGENVEISLQLAANVGPVMADAAQLQSALINLSTNARDAMPGGGRLTITTANRHFGADQVEVVAGDYIMLEISDTGTGMTPEVLEHLFDPFFTTKERGRGIGLGLSMVFGFIKQSGGHISVDSEIGGGTTFSIFLPRAECEPKAVETNDRLHHPSIVSGETILVVEDNAALRRVSSRRIEALGYRVLEADGATAALACLETERVDLMFTDVVMPGDMDGCALSQQAMARWPELKVIITSGFPGHRQDKYAETAGRRLLSKPYPARELELLLREMLEPSNATPRGDDATIHGTRLESRRPMDVRPAHGAETKTSRGSSCILVVDDDPEVSRIVAAFLGRAGFDVTTVGDGNAALAQLGQGRTFHALVTDFAMPGANGSDLVLQARDLQPDLPALIITGYPGAEELEHLPSGVATLIKPFRRDALVAAVTELLAGAAAASRSAVGSHV